MKNWLPFSLESLFCSLCLLFICCTSLAANKFDDTLVVNNLLKRAEAFTKLRYLTPASFKTALNITNQARVLCRRAKLIKEEGRTYLIQSKLSATQPANDSTHILAKKAIELFREAHAQELEADAEMQYVHCIQFTPSISSQAEILCDSALLIYDKVAPKSNGIIDALYYKAMFSYFKQERQKAIKYCNRALTIYDAIHSDRKQKIYFFLGIIYGNASGDAKGFAYTFKSLQLAERFRDSSVAFSASAAIGGFYQAMNQPSKWLNYIERAKTYVSYEKDNGRALTIAGYLAEALISNRQYNKTLKIINEAFAKGDNKTQEYSLMNVFAMDCYTYLHQFSAAEKLYPKVMTLIKNPAAPWLYESLARFSLIRLMIARNELERAKVHLRALYKQPLNAAYVNLRLTMEDLSFKVDSSQGKYIEAIRHFEKYKNLNDSVNNLAHNTEVSQLQIQYQIQKKDKDIEQKSKNIDLLKRHAALQETALQSQAQTRNIAFAATGLLALLLALGYNRYQFKQKANKELAKQQIKINVQNNSLKTLLNERDWLLKEVHHRTKNNLQIVISLLNSQLANVNEATAHEVLRESQHRMHTISLIHQKLYQSENPSGIEMSVYIRELVDYLEHSFNIKNSIVFQLELSPLMMDISQAVPLGLIINEAITNALKYAFSESDSKGTIRVDLNHMITGQVLLLIADSGKGLSEGFNPESSKSLGMSLIRGLSRQLRGQITFKNVGGLQVSLSLPSVKPTKPISDPDDFHE